MLTTLALSLAFFAPAAPAPATNPPAAKEAPKEAAPAAIGTQPPRVMELKAEADGKVKITVMRPKAFPVLNRPGGAPGAQPIMIQAPEKVELTDVKDLKITTAGGKEVTKEDALKTLAKGGIVIVTADGKAIAPAYLKVFKEDVLVLVSPELTGGPGNVGMLGGGGGIWTIPVNPGGNPRPAPAPAPAPKID